MEITIKINGRFVSVEVSAEVDDYLEQAKRNNRKLYRERQRYWDGREYDEYIIAAEGRLPYCATPEELVCQRETLDEILVVLALCSATQWERFLLYALHDFSYAEIAKICGCSKVSVCQSIVGVRRKFLPERLTLCLYSITSKLYERLSRDDELQGESCSIQHQKAMLEDYAQRNGFLRFRHYTDDGVSGTRFDRPGFMAMMEEVEDGNVETIIVKDMSRLGRDYLKVGQVMELLRQRGVRLIAINDNVDSANGGNDFTLFLNIIYEFYARDTSRKIRFMAVWQI